jgi:hypothetical protein
MKLKREEVISLIYGDGGVRRFTQDSPVLPDVWIAYAEAPGEQQDLLLTPYLNPARKPMTPGMLWRVLERTFYPDRMPPAPSEGKVVKLVRPPILPRAPSFERVKGESPGLAYNQATVVAKLWFDELVRAILPLSSWWNKKISRNSASRVGSKEQRGLRIEDLQFPEAQERIARALAYPENDKQSGHEDWPELSPDLLWTIRVVGTIALANATNEKGRKTVWPPPIGQEKAKRVAYFRCVVRALATLMKGVVSAQTSQPMVHMVSLNRPATISIWRSSAAVKADAAKILFNIKCEGIAWAIIDSGIDAKHPAFLRRAADVTSPGARVPWAQRTRVLATYDFTIIRRLLSSDPELTKKLPNRIQQKLKEDPFLQKNLRYRLQTGHEIDWGLLQDFIQVRHEDGSYLPPVHEHGTHVAGILGADWPKGADRNLSDEDVRGICPDINLYDFRVLDDKGEGDEFSVMAAMQFIRHLNAHQDYTVLHGVNLSLSIPHDVRNYACGRTPVCEECDRLIGAGIVVVTAAGNEGYRMTSPDGQEGYEAISISDPGNAEAVITVGSTHRDAPHSYGVSYFSSRGPTGDGRVKPDLVAPGEKIESTIPDCGLTRMDGTSMASPHVSGVAALLMARHRELVGRPQRIKKILCDTATDLGRERYFQGCGLVDALRALQSV